MSSVLHKKLLTFFTNFIQCKKMFLITKSRKCGFIKYALITIALDNLPPISLTTAIYLEERCLRRAIWGIIRALLRRSKYKFLRKNAGSNLTCVLIIAMYTLWSKYFDCRQNYSSHCKTAAKQSIFIILVGKNRQFAQGVARTFSAILPTHNLRLQAIVILHAKALPAKYVRYIFVKIFWM